MKLKPNKGARETRAMAAKEAISGDTIAVTEKIEEYCGQLEQE